MTESKPRILVIDDDPPLLILLTGMLSRIGCDSLTARDGSEGLDMLNREAVDLVILDLMLPDISGFKVLEKIRANNRFDDLPVLILSAMADAESISRGFELGADGYVTKPYIPNTLTGRVRSLLTRGRKTS